MLNQKIDFNVKGFESICNDYDKELTEKDEIIKNLQILLEAKSESTNPFAKSQNS